MDLHNFAGLRAWLACCWLVAMSLCCIPATSPAFAQETVGSAPKFPLSFGSTPVPGKGGNDLQSKIKIAGQYQLTPDGKQGLLHVRVELAPGWHIYSVTQPDRGPQRTEIRLEPSDAYRLAGPFRPDQEPEVSPSPYFPVPEEKHHGTVVWSAPLHVASGTAPNQLSIVGKIEGQICQEGQCVPLHALDTRFSATFGGILEATQDSSISGPSPETLPSTPSKQTSWANVDVRLWMQMLGLGFLGGMILNLMPCALPVIGLKILSFVEQSHGNRSRAFVLNLVYSLGVLSVFMVLAALAVAINLAWGEQFTYAGFKIAMIVLVFAMALSFLGVWQIPIPGFVGSGRTGELSAREGASGAFFKGVFATILATPCSGPLLAPVFSYTLNVPPPITFTLFLSLGLGMAAPYLLIGSFPELMRWFPKPGAWMETFKELMGFVLLFTMVYLFFTLADRDLFLPTLSLVVGVWFACWLIGRVPYTAGWDSRIRAWLVGVGVASLVGFVSFKYLGPHQSYIPWKPFSTQELAAAQREGRTVLIDFTANWCLTCQYNKKAAIDTKRVAQLIEEHDVVPLLADWSDGKSAVGQQTKQMLDALGYHSIPLLAIFPAGSPPPPPIILPDVLTEGQVLQALRQAGPSQSVAAKRSAHLDR